MLSLHFCICAATIFVVWRFQGDGRLLFEQIVAMDLEGIVCKRKDSPYKVTEKASRCWFKLKNSRNCQLQGREEVHKPQQVVASSQPTFRATRIPESCLIVLTRLHSSAPIAYL